MATHSLHPLIPAAGLADNCPRCDEIAGQPFDALDDDNLRDLIDRTRRWMADDEDCLARSRNEQTAMRVVEKALVCKRVLDRLDGEARAVLESDSPFEDPPLQDLEKGLRAPRDEAA